MAVNCRSTVFEQEKSGMRSNAFRGTSEVFQGDVSDRLGARNLIQEVFDVSRGSTFL